MGSEARYKSAGIDKAGKHMQHSHIGNGGNVSGAWNYAHERS
jgi:hypothetical protein